jgi:proton-dependent oligopeptide transporter, POT family
MFGWFFWTINFGGLSTIISTNVEKYYSYWLAFLLPVIVFTGSIIVLVVGRRRYIRTPPGGSIIVRAYHVTMTAFRMRWRLGKDYHAEHILDLAKDTLLPINHGGKETTVESDQNQFIDDLKQAWRACRVFAFYPFFWVCSIQIGGNMIAQAAQMNVGKFLLTRYSMICDSRCHPS